MEIGKSILESLIKLSIEFSKADLQFCLVGGLALSRNFKVINRHNDVMVLGKTKILRTLLQDPHLKEGIIRLLDPHVTVSIHC